MSNPRSLAQAIIVALFLGSVGGAWAWFAGAPGVTAEEWRFEVQPRIEGWRFEDRPLSAAVMQALATPTLVNGAFVSDAARPVTVFAAEWTASEARQMVVVQHTPDLCWVGAGWEPVRAGQPERVSVRLGDETLIFQCRMFGVPRTSHRELVLWCTLVGGQVLEEGDRWSLEADPAQDRAARFALAGRRMAVGQFVDNIRTRRAATAHKQFVRFSVPVGADWTQSLKDLEAFAPRWLALHRSTATP